jgi:HEAT repeat protein
MSKPLIFDPATGELISNVREIKAAADRSARLRPGAGANGHGVAATVEERLTGILCEGGERQRMDAMLTISSERSREWSAKVVAAVVYQLAEPNDTVRAEALRVARLLGFQAAVIPVANMILRDCDRISRLAVLALAESYGAQGTALADCILPVLEQSDADLAEAAVKALGSIGLAPTCVDTLALLIRHREVRVRINCVLMLGLLGARAAAVSGLVVLRLDDPDEVVRNAAAEALELIGFHGAALDEVKRMLNHDNVARRVEMLRILGRFGSSAQESSVLIVPLMKCEVPEVREAARRTLRFVGLGRDCIRQIEYLARHPSHDVREAALDLLEECGPAPESCALAVSLMADRDLAIRERAAIVISKVGIPAVALPHLRKLLRDERESVRILALGALENAAEGARPAAKLIIERIEDASSEVASRAAGAFVTSCRAEDCLPDISRILHNRRQDKRLLMLSALARSGHRAAAALPLVTAAMGDADWLVRDAACEAFIAIGFNESCIPEVRRLIKHQDRDYRLAVIRALGACGMSARAAAEFLTQRESDSDTEVGRAAREALASILGTGA